MKARTGELLYKGGETIIREGEPGLEMFIIEDGDVEILRGEGSLERRLGTLSPGDFFGEMSVVDDLPRGATARALTDCRLLAIDHSTFDQMLRRFPEVAIRMLRRMSTRMRESEAAAEAARKEAARSPRPDVASTSRAGAPVLPLEAPSGELETAMPPEPEPRAVQNGGKAWELVVVGTGVALAIGDQAEVRVGRYDSVTGIRPEIDLTAIDTGRTTSRRHARFFQEEGRLFVFEEIATANGAHVNGARVGCGVRVEVKEGDLLQFGDVKAVLKRR